MKLNNPIIRSEMKTRMRTWKTPIGMIVYLGILMAYLLLFVGISSINTYYTDFTDYSTIGLTIFYSISIVQFFIIILIGPASTAGAISSEREKQTFDLLLVTQMTPTEIIFGKLISSIMWIFALCFATVPLYSIAFLYGGVNPIAVIYVILFYILISLFAGSIGIFYSTIFKKTVTSSIMSYVTIFMVFVLTFVVALFEIFLSYNFSYTLEMPIAFYFNPLVAFLVLMTSTLSGSDDIIGMLFANANINTGWFLFVNILFMGVVSVLLLFISIRRVTPVKKKNN